MSGPKSDTLKALFWTFSRLCGRGVLFCRTKSHNFSFSNTDFRTFDFFDFDLKILCVP